MTKLSVVLVACLFLSACGTDHESYTIFQPAAPSTAQKQPPAPAGGSVAPAQPGPVVSNPTGNGLYQTISGPRGCLKAEYMPDVLEWHITGVPINAAIDKGYSHDSASGCGATTSNLRTQNDHLRVIETRHPELGLKDLLVRFDKNADRCGRDQVADININGVNVLGEVLDYDTDCRPEIPKTPTCGTVPGYIHVGSVEVTDKVWEVDGYNAYVNVPVTYLNVSDPHVVELHWQNGALSNIKTTKEIVPMCDDVPRDASFNYFGHDVLHRADHGAVYSTVTR